MTTADRSSSRKVIIETSTLILVEGVDDHKFLKEFLSFSEIQDIQIEMVGSKDYFKKFIRLILPQAPNLSRLEHLAVVRDADCDFSAAETSVTMILQAFASRFENRATGTTSIRTSQFLFPDNQHEGTLETLLWSTVPNGQRSCVEEFLTCIGKDWGQGSLAAHRVDKARVYAYLASGPLKMESHGRRGSIRSRPGLLTGISVGAGIWDLNHDAFNPLREFAKGL